MLNAKKCYTISFLFLFLLLSSPVLLAVNSTITGRVIDSQTKQPLPGANVYLAGTAIGVASDLEGGFFISNVPPGRFTLVVDYIGYRQERLAIEVTQRNQKINLTFAMKYAAVDLDSTVVVTAQAEGQMEAINQQLSARAIVNVVSSDKIREMPDANAAESVGRLPGVTVLREGGEGKKLVIRGLSPKYNTISIEGVRVPPTDTDDRSADLSMIGTYTLDGIEVMKAITADQDADAVGGNVDFKIKEARGDNNKFAFDIVTKGTYNNLKGTYNDYNLLAEVSTRRFDGRLGVLAMVYNEKRNHPSQSMGASYGLLDPSLDKKNQVLTTGLSLSETLRETKRLGGTFVVDYRIPEGKIAFKNVLNQINNHGIGYSDQYNYQGNVRTYGFSDNKSSIDLMTNVLSYRQKLSIFNMEGKLSHSLSKTGYPQNIGFNFLEYSGFGEYNDPFIYPADIPSHAKNNLNSTFLNHCTDDRGESSDRQITAQFDLGMNYALTRQISGLLKVGGKFRQSEREKDWEAWGGYLWVGGAKKIRQALLEAFPDRLPYPSGDSQFYFPHFIDDSYDTENFLEGRYELAHVMDAEFMNDVMAIVRQHPYTTTADAYYHGDIGSTTGDYSGRERLSAGYIMTDLNIGSMFKLIPGVRFEELVKTYTASQGDSRGRTADIDYPHEMVTATTIDRHWLPMVHARLKPVDWFDIRFAYTQTLARPNFNLLTPFYNISQNNVAYNNYKLKPERAESFDLYCSFHHNYVGLFTIGFFKKEITDLIYSTKEILYAPSIYDLPNDVRNYHMGITKNNQYATKVNGIEVDWQTNFWFLPGLLKGLVVSANFTYNEAETKYPLTELNQWLDTETWQWQYAYVDTFYTARLINSPTYLMNFTLGYDYKDFSVRGTMQYRSDIYTYHDFWPELRGVSDDFLQYGLTMTQDLPWYGVQLVFDMRNITSASEVYLNKGNRFPTNESFYGMTADFGVRIRL
ncbi:MAG: TonB-dependent receptor [Calditrichaeota bacterium]|nr:MAG: TonB-dependent receptor [Calditrichota bacterium]